jgi:long-subunit fatty acid transport protein
VTQRNAHFVRSCVLAVVYTACAYNPAHADWAQSLGIGQKSTNLGSAVSATSDDYDAFYTNPAGAAEFTRPFVGFGIKTIDTRGLSVQQTDVTPPSMLQSGAYYFLDLLGQDTLADLFTPGADGLDLSPDRTLPNADIGIIPSFGAYMPVPGMENVVVGIGAGTPFLLSAEYGNQDTPGNYGKFSTTGAGLVIVETSPSVSVKVNDKLNVGASVGVTTFKYLKVSNELGAPDLGTGSLGSVNLQTDSTITLPGIEPSFATDPTSVSYTLGMQYKLTPKLTLA